MKSFVVFALRQQLWFRLHRGNVNLQPSLSPSSSSYQSSRLVSSGRPRWIYFFLILSGAFSTCKSTVAFPALVTEDRWVTRSWVSIPVYLILLSMGSGVGVFGHFLRHLCSTTFHSRYIPVSRLAGTVGEPLFKGSPLLSNWTGSSKLNQKEVCFDLCVTSWVAPRAQHSLVKSL